MLKACPDFGMFQADPHEIPESLADHMWFQLSLSLTCEQWLLNPWQGWWLVRGLYYPIYYIYNYIYIYTVYIGDYNNPRTGNPYKPTMIKWNDRGIYFTLLMWLSQIPVKLCHKLEAVHTQLLFWLRLLKANSAQKCPTCIKMPY